MKFNANGLEHFYKDSADGENSKTPLVLIHGFPHTHELWREQVSELSKKYRIITYDLREHGQSEVGDGNLLVEFFVDDLIGLLDHLKLRSVVLGGLSMGGYIALRAIERNPERFSALILCDTASTADDNATKLKRSNSIRMIRERGFEAFVENYMDGVLMPETLQSNPELLDRFRSMIFENIPATVKATLVALSARMDLNDSLAQIRVPTLIVFGDKDQITPLVKAKILQSGIAGSELKIIPGVGHLSSFEAPQAFNRIISEFLDRLAKISA